VTFQVDGYDDAINVASRENGTYAGPKLVLNLSVDYPNRPSALAGTAPYPGRVSLAWQDNSNNETGFVVEVSTDNGATWTPWATVAANATAALFDAPGGSGNQRYRVYATRVIPNAPPLNSSPTLSVTLDPGSVVPTYGGWTSSYGLPSDGTGLGAPMASPVGDGIPNTLKYALGIDPWQSGYQGHLAHGTVEVSGTTYLSLTYTRPEPPPSDVTYTVEVSGDLVTWSAAQTAQVSSTDNGDRTRTIVVRDTQPMPSAGRRFIRLKVAR
jgi:hypothetical protein